MKKISLYVALAAALCLSASGYTQTSTTPAWAKTYDGTHGSDDLDKGYAITTDASGNVYVTGMIDINGDPAITTIKYNGSGVQQWATATNLVYSTTPCNVEGGFDIKVDNSTGNVYVACAALVNTSTEYVDLALIKYNSSGTPVTGYPKYYVDGGCQNPGVNPKGVTLVLTNGTLGLEAVIGGSTWSGTNWSAIVLKENISTGATWAWTYTSGSGTSENRINDIKYNGAYVYATGFVNNTGAGKDIFTVKLAQSNGSVASGWPQTWNSSGTQNEVGNAIDLDGTNGNVYVAGQSNNDGVILKYPNTGTTLTWSATYNGAGTSSIDSWNDIVLIGTSTTAPALFVSGYAQPSTGNYNYALAAYTSSGSLSSSWGTNPYFYDGAYSGTEATGTDKAYGVEYSSNTGVVYMTGTADEGGLLHNVNITTIGRNGSNGNAAYGPAKYDMNTDATPLADDDNYAKNAFRVVYNSNYCVDDIYITGASFVTNNNFDYVTLKYTCGSCVSCLGPNGRMMSSSNQTFTASFYPNPFGTSAEIRFNETPKSAILTISDLSGKIVRTVDNISSASIMVDKGELVNGVYFYKVTQDDVVLTNGKFVIQD